MKTSILVFSMLFFLSLLTAPARASSPPWTGDGVYTFDDSDPYFIEGWIADTATVNITGGSFGSLGAFGNSTINMSAGNANTGIGSFDSSCVYLYGGSINEIGAKDNSSVKIFAENWVLNPSPYIGYEGLLAGNWQNNGGYFEILIVNSSWSHIEIIPEPCSLLLLSTGVFFLRIKRY